MRRICTKEDMKALEKIMRRFFTRSQMLAADVLKTKHEIANAWHVILQRRRLVERDDTCPISDPNIRAKMYTFWMHDWFKENLTDKQRSTLEAKSQALSLHTYTTIVLTTTFDYKNVYLQVNIILGKNTHALPGSRFLPSGSPERNSQPTKM